MSTRRRRAAPILFLLLAATAFPSSADAQLGALKRKAQQAARGAVEDRLPFTPEAAPEFDDRVLEITDDRLGRLLEGFAAEAAHAKAAGKEFEEQSKAFERALKEHEKALEAHGKAAEKYQACAADFWKKEEAAASANEAKERKALEDMDDEEFEAYAEAMAEKGERIAKLLAEGKNDAVTKREAEEYQREFEAFLVEQQRRTMAVAAAGMAESRRARTEDARLVAACGEQPESPPPPVSPLNGPEGILAVQGAEAAQMTAEQYSVMRERVLFWWEQDRRPAGMGFTRGEIDVLEGSADAVDEAFERMKKAGVPL